MPRSAPAPTQHIGQWQRYGIDGVVGQPLRVGVIVGGTVVPHWQAASLHLLVDSGVAEIAIAVLSDGPPLRRNLREFLRHVGFYAFGGALGRPEAIRPEAITELLDGVPTLGGRLRQAGGDHRALAKEDVGAIQAAGLDLILDFGTGLVAGEIRAAARWGVWSFHHGEECGSAGHPPAFWELHDGSTVISIALQQLTEGHDGGRNLRKGVLAVDPASYARTLQRVYMAAIDFPLQACRDLVMGNAPELDALPGQALRSVRCAPGNREVVTTAGRIGVAAMRRYLRFAFVLERWTIGQLDGGPEQLLAGHTSGARWFRLPGRSSVLADPVIVPGSGGRVVLCEALDWAEGLGTIARVTFSPPGIVQSVPEDLIQDPTVHFSFPSMVPLEDGLLCVPEAAMTRTLRGYFLSSDAGMVLGSSTLVDGLAAIDPTIFWFDDRWWLACTEAGPTQLSHLWLYHAGSPLGPWRAHKRNPVVVDVRAARPAGRPFMHQQAMYRPAQDCSSRYGGAVTLNKIVQLTPETFLEEHVGSIRPDPDGSQRAGLHTVSVDGGAVVIDGCSDTLHPLAGWYRLRAPRKDVRQSLPDRAGRRA